MSDGHAQNLAGKPWGELVPTSQSAGPPVNPALWWREDMRAALRARDIGTVYQLILEATGMSQHRLAELVGQAQSDVSEILKGRRVKDVMVLELVNTNAGGGLVSDGGSADCGAVRVMEVVWPSGIALREEVSNHCALRPLTAVRGERHRKGVP